MNANKDYFELMHPKCDFWGFGMHRIRENYTEMHPKGDFCDFGMHRFLSNFQCNASHRKFFGIWDEKVFNTMHPKYGFLFYGMHT